MHSSSSHLITELMHCISRIKRLILLSPYKKAFIYSNSAVPLATEISEESTGPGRLWGLVIRLIASYMS